MCTQCPIQLVELPIYGLGRVGVSKPTGIVLNMPANTGPTYSRPIGEKFYELADHLGNVRMVISDIKRSMLTDDCHDGRSARRGVPSSDNPSRITVPTNRHLVLLAAVTLLAFTGPAHAQPGWEWINPFPTGQDLNDVIVAPDGALLAVGNHGSILATTDDGATWRTRYEGDYRLLRGAAFADDRNGWAVGNNRAVARTTDGGRSWRPVDIGVDALFHDVAFSTTEIGMIVGGVGLAGVGALRTTDAGESWSIVTLPASPTLMDVEFRGAIGLAVGHGGIILRSTDRGATWSVRLADSAGASGVLDAVRFVTDAVVVAAGENGRIIRSTDAGLTWEQVRYRASGEAFHGVAFGDAMHGVAVGERGVPLFTTDGGRTWSASTGSTNIRMAVTFVDSLTAWSVGPFGHVSTTTDGGRTWSTRSRSIVGFPDYDDLDVDREGRIVAVGREGVVALSDPGHEYLRALSSSNRTHLSGVAWNGSGRFLAVGDNGTMLRGGAAGGALASVSTGVTAQLYDIVFTRNDIGYVVGTGVVLRSGDGGEQWSSLSSPSTDVIVGVDAPDDSVVWIVGRKGLIYRSTDGGATWQDRRSPTTNYLTAVHAFDAERAVVTGASGVAIRTTDGGLTWTFAPVQGNPSLQGVAFVDALNGVAVGELGVAAVTTDGGVSWTRHDAAVAQAGPGLVNLAAVVPFGRRVVAAGNEGVIVSLDLGASASVGVEPVDRTRTLVRLIDGELEMTVGSQPRRVTLHDAIGRRVFGPVEVVPVAGVIRLSIDRRLSRGLYYVRLHGRGDEMVVPVMVR